MKKNQMTQWAIEHGIENLYMIIGSKNKKPVFMTTHPGAIRWVEDQELACREGGGFVTREGANTALKTSSKIYKDVDILNKKVQKFD